jgi:hypothetical protein
MGLFTPKGRLLWSLASSGKSTNLTGAGNSGNWNASLAQSPLSLAAVDDLALLVAITGTITGTGSPTLQVSVDVYDDRGNLYPAIMQTAGLTGNGASTPVYGGLHGATATTWAVLPEFGRVSWTVTGSSPVFPGVEIALYGR